MKKLIQQLLPIADFFLLPFVYPAAWLLKRLRKAGVHNLPHCKRALLNVGVFPIINHYYEPQFDNRNPNPEFFQDRYLPGINWNVLGQLEILERFKFSDELNNIPQEKTTELIFYLNNGAFVSGDAEYWYQIIRTFKPVIAVAKMLKRHLENIITFIKHRITNAFAEGINSKIQHIKATAR